MLVKSHIYYCISVLLTGVVYTNQDTIKRFNVLWSYHCVRGMAIYQFTHNIICKSYLQIQVHEITYLTINITHYSSSCIRLLSSAVWHRLTTPPAPLCHGLGAGGQTAPKVRGISYPRHALHLRRRIVPAHCPAHQCACLTTCIPNITLHSSVREQQPQTSNTISNGKYNPVRSIHQLHVKHLKCYTPPPPAQTCSNQGVI